jgi:hypothetical protein
MGFCWPCHFFLQVYSTLKGRLVLRVGSLLRESEFYLFGFGFCFGFWLGCLGFTLDADRATVAKRRDRFGTRLREPEPNGETATEKLGL